MVVSSGDTLRELFRSLASHDEHGFRSAAEGIIREERLKNHRLLADDLERILANGKHRPRERRNVRSYNVPRDRERDVPLLEVTTSDLSWERLVARQELIDVLQQIALEHQRRDVLSAAGLRPTERVLFHGPPGCGKTIGARIMAGVLSYPLVTVRFDAIVSSYLGATAMNLRRVFDFIQDGCWVVLFDEFDAIGKDRDNPYEHGELKRVVNALLQLMDDFRGQSLLIAATNHVGLLDEALWRHFESVIGFEPPTEQDRELLLRLFLRAFDTSHLRLMGLAQQLRGATGADVERISIDAARRAVLAGRSAILKDDIVPSIAEFRKRSALLSEVRGRADLRPARQTARAQGHVKEG